MATDFTTLHKRKPREKSGSRASSRFEFQANFSILKILDLHETGNDYRAFFDHFDDLTIFDSSDTPAHIRFYQIKGRDNNQPWTIKQLIREEKVGDAPKSIIGKMYKNVADFSAETEQAVFASNASYSFVLKDGTKTTPDTFSIDGTNLHDSEIQAIDAILEPDFPSPRKPACAGILLFERTNLPLQEQATFVTGRLVEYLSKFAGDENFPIKALYDVLFRNVMARASNTEDPDTLDKLYRNKSFSRADIAGLIQRASTKRNFEASWSVVVTELSAEKYSSIQIIRIKNAAMQYLRERARGDKTPNEFSAKIKTIIASETTVLASSAKIVDAMKLLQTKIDFVHPYAGEALFGALLIEVYEAIDGNVQ